MTITIILSLYLIGVLTGAPIVIFNWKTQRDEMAFVDEDDSTFSKICLILLSWITVGLILVYFGDMLTMIKKNTKDKL